VNDVYKGIERCGSKKMSVRQQTARIVFCVGAMILRVRGVVKGDDLR